FHLCQYGDQYRSVLSPHPWHRSQRGKSAGRHIPELNWIQFFEFPGYPLLCLLSPGSIYSIPASRENYNVLSLLHVADLHHVAELVFRYLPPSFEKVIQVEGVPGIGVREIAVVGMAGDVVL